MTILDDLQEQIEEKSARIQQLADLAGGEEGWNDEQRAEWEAINPEYDELVEKRDAEKQIIEIEQRRQFALASSARVEHQRKTEVGQMRANRAGLVTEEMRCLSLQAWAVRGRQELTSKHEEAIAVCQVAGSDGAMALSNPTNRNLHYEDLWTRNGVNHVAPYMRQRRRDVFESRDMGTGGSGGETIPVGFSYELEIALLMYGGVRLVARTFRTDSEGAFHWPTWNDVNNAAVILGEAADIGPSVDPTTSELIFNAYKYSSQPVLLSAELLMDSAFNLAQILGQQLGIRIARGTNAHYTTGTGTGQPEGITVGTPMGVTATGAAVTADDLIDMVASIDPMYLSMPSCGWMMSQSTLAAVRKLKDTTNNYLWQPSLQAGNPDILLGYPITLNNDMPAVGSSTRPIVFGAMEKYMIRDAGPYRFYRLDELYRGTDQTGFVSFSRHDGKVVDAGTGPIKHYLMGA